MGFPKAAKLGIPRLYRLGNHKDQEAMIRRYGEAVVRGQKYRLRQGVYAVLLRGD